MTDDRAELQGLVYQFIRNWVAILAKFVWGAVLATAAAAAIVVGLFWPMIVGNFLGGVPMDIEWILLWFVWIFILYTAHLAVKQTLNEDCGTPQEDSA